MEFSEACFMHDAGQCTHALSYIKSKLGWSCLLRLESRIL